MTCLTPINEIACAPIAPGSDIHTVLGASHWVGADTERGQVPLAQQPKMEKRYE